MPKPRPVAGRASTTTHSASFLSESLLPSERQQMDLFFPAYTMLVCPLSAEANRSEITAQREDLRIRKLNTNRKLSTKDSAASKVRFVADKGKAHEPR